MWVGLPVLAIDQAFPEPLAEPHDIFHGTGRGRQLSVSGMECDVESEVETLALSRAAKVVCRSRR